MTKKKKIGLALGGGGARGCSHIGVIKALEEAGIQIDCVAGTSIGSFIGGVYAAGDIKKLEKILLETTWKDVVKHFDPVLPTKGFFEGKKIVKLLKAILPNPNFKNARIPYAAVATDLTSGKEVVIKNGSIIKAIRASIAIPSIITPLKWKNRYLIDGGVVNPLPINVIQQMEADIVIAVDLNHSFVKEKKISKGSRKNRKIPLSGKITSWLTPNYPNIIDVVENSIFVMQDQITQKNLLKFKPDFLIQPSLGSSGVFDFHKAKEMIEEGYKQGKKIIPKLKRLL
ncbi:patatin-like phospholipase family protein [candidate division KSB1 bacterium]